MEEAYDGDVWPGYQGRPSGIHLETRDWLCWATLGSCFSLAATNSATLFMCIVSTNPIKAYSYLSTAYDFAAYLTETQYVLCKCRNVVDQNLTQATS